MSAPSLVVHFLCAYVNAVHAYIILVARVNSIIFIFSNFSHSNCAKLFSFSFSVTMCFSIELSATASESPWQFASVLPPLLFELFGARIRGDLRRSLPHQCPKRYIALLCLRASSSPRSASSASVGAGPPRTNLVVECISGLTSPFVIFGRDRGGHFMRQSVFFQVHHYFRVSSRF